MSDGNNDSRSIRKFNQNVTVITKDHFITFLKTSHISQTPEVCLCVLLMPHLGICPSIEVTLKVRSSFKGGSCVHMVHCSPQ